jgi:hypothetical protein
MYQKVPAVGGGRRNNKTRKGKEFCFLFFTGVKVGLYMPQGFDAKTVSELFRGSKPIIRPVQAHEGKKSLGLLHIKRKGPNFTSNRINLFFSSPCKTFNFPTNPANRIPF